MNILARNLPFLDTFSPQRVYFVGFNFDEYPRVSIREIATEAKRAKWEKENQKRKEKRRLSRTLLSWEIPAYCGKKRGTKLDYGPVVASRLKHRKGCVPRYGVDDLFAPVNEPQKPATVRTRINSHWGVNIWNNGGF